MDSTARPIYASSCSHKESKRSMYTKIVDVFECEGRIILIHLEADELDQLTIYACYTDGRPVNEWRYFLHQSDRIRLLAQGEEDPIREFVRSVHFDIESGIPKQSEIDKKTLH
jgi:hypothetical protein